MPAPQSTKGTVLVVEDAESVRHMVCRMLHLDGYEVLEAPNGAVALQQIEQCARPVSLVLTDVVMPEMGGAELALQLSQRWPDLPVLFMTGYTESPMVRTLELQPVRVLTKPFTASALLRKVAEILRPTD